MSDENATHTRDIIHDVNKMEERISELEANTIISNELQIKINDKLQDYIKINTSNIQNNFKGFKDFKFLQESQMKRCDHLQEQIAELGKRIGNAWESISELEESRDILLRDQKGNIEAFKVQREQLTELRKDQIKGAQNRNKIIGKVGKLREKLGFHAQVLTAQGGLVAKNQEVIAELREEMKCYMEFWSQQQNQINELKEVAGMKRKQVERIDELEKMFDLDSGHLELHRKTNQEIAELEASDKNTNEAFADVSVKFIELEKKADDNHVDMMSNHKEIHELRKELDAVDKIQDRNWKERGKEIDEHTENIAGIRRHAIKQEEIDRLFVLEHRIGDFTDIDYITIKEILRELINIDKNWVAHDDKEPYKELLTKLDSGGEKLGDIKDMVLPNGKQYQPDSKPPEPITWGDYNAPAGGKITIPESLRREAIEAGNIRLPEPKYIREADGAKLIEPREDSGDDKKYIDPVKQTWYNTKTHIVVKREDLKDTKQLLADIYHDIHGVPKVFRDRAFKLWCIIKEEYNL